MVHFLNILLLSGADDLQSVLVAAFPNLSKEAKIIGLHEKEPGLLYDLRLVCASPEKFASDVYTIVTDANRKRASPVPSAILRHLICFGSHICTHPPKLMCCCVRRI